MALLSPMGRLQLVKTSEDSFCSWVTENEKPGKFVLENIHFVDVTDTWALVPPLIGGDQIWRGGGCNNEG